MISKIIIRNKSTIETVTTTKTVTATIKQEEMVEQDSMGTAMGAESRGAARPTSGKRNEMHQRDPITIVHGRKGRK